MFGQGVILLVAAFLIEQVVTGVVMVTKMPEGLVGAIVQLVLAVAASGILVKVLTLRQDRRKIAGDASASEANAASTLSGAALEMVKAAQDTANAAEARAKNANETAEATKLEANRLWTELNKARWQIHWLQMREKVLEAALEQANISVPPSPRLAEFPTYPPPPPAQDPPKGATGPPVIDFDQGP